eukprot:1138804-Pelagomonas_calceolata.AAC.3
MPRPPTSVAVYLSFFMSTAVGQLRKSGSRAGNTGTRSKMSLIGAPNVHPSLSRKGLALEARLC